MNAVKNMAYLRKEKEIIEVDYPLKTVWKAISKAVLALDWDIEEEKEASHQVKIKTKSNFMAYSSNLVIELTEKDKKTTRLSLSAETPVTTITGIVDFGRTRERIDSFLLALIKQLKGEAPKQTKKDEEKD
jgi:hypothetical protein